jgi:methionine-rich copper-binding protein CopC
MTVVRPALVRAVRVAAVLVGLALPTALSSGASAHDSLAGSSPASGAALTTAPAAVTLSFEEAPLAAGLAVAVLAPDRTSVTAGTPVVTGTAVVTPLRPLTASGTYAVAWRAVSADGHPVTGTFSFSLALAPAAASPSVTTAPPEPTASSTPLPGVSDPSNVGDLTPWMVGGSVALLGAIVLVGVVAWRRSA